MVSRKFATQQCKVTQFVVLCFVTALVGCSEQVHDVVGKVTRDGQPIAMEAKQVLKVGLRSASLEAAASMNSTEREVVATLFTASVNKDGTFRFSDVTPGTYHLLVSDFLSYPSKDQLAAYFRKTPQQFEVVVPSASNQELAIDIESRWYKSTSR